MCEISDCRRRQGAPRDLESPFMTGYAEMTSSSNFLQPDIEIFSQPFAMDELESFKRV